MVSITQRLALLRLATRGAALALGAFAVGNAVAGWWLSGTFFDQNIWWVDSRPLPVWLANPLVAISGALLVAFGGLPVMGGRRRKWTRAGLVLLLAMSVWNTVAYWGLLALGAIENPFPLPLSFFVALLLYGVWWGTGVPQGRVEQHPSRWVRLAVVLAASGALPVLFPVAQMVFYGKTDYRRPADAAVVFGAAVWPGNRPSQALSDRVNTAIGLYHEGLVPKLLFSGGPSRSPEIIHEVAAMRQMALDAGVPDGDILLDAAGVNSYATVANTTRVFRREGWTRVLAVSHFYHLPRVKMTYARAGFPVFTVPAQEPRPLLKLPYYMAREVLALWYYTLRPLWES